MNEASVGTDPLVSIVMPIRNEASHLDECLRRVFSQDYPANRLEVIVADGMSDDGTRELLDRWQQQQPHLVVIDNPNRSRASALNLAIGVSRGEILIPLDGHTDIASDFVSQSVALLRDHPEAWSAGGPIVHAGHTRVARAIAAAMSHPCGVGNASHRFAQFEGWGEGTAFAAYHRWVFDRVGNYDEQMVRTEDDELHYRISQSGGRHYLSPRVRYVYYVRDSFGKLFSQYFQYSFWRIPVMRKHGRPTTLRQLGPALFYLAMLIAFVAGCALHNLWLAVGLPAAYLAVLMAVGISQIPQCGLATALLVPVAMLTMHSAYALGMWYAWVALLLAPNAWSNTGSMTRLNR